MMGHQRSFIMDIVCLDTTIGCKLVLKNVRQVPKIRLNLISTRRLNDDEFVSHFGDGKWKITKRSLVMASGIK